MELDEEFMPEIYTLEDEEGNSLTFELLDTLELDDERYFALMPYFESAEEMIDDDGELVILKEEIVDGESMMASIDDDEEYDRVGAIMLERISKLFDDEDEEED